MKRFLSFHRRHRRGIAAAIVLMVLEAALALVVLYLPRVVLDSVIPSKNARMFVTAFGVILLLALLKEAAGLGHRLLMIKVHQDVALTLMKKMTLAVYAQPVSYWDANASSYMRARIMADARSLDPLSVAALLRIIIDSLFIVAALGVLLSLNWPLTLVLMGALVFHTMAVCLPYKHITKRSHEQSEIWAQANSQMQDRLQGIRTTILFNKQRAECRRLAGILTGAKDYSVRFLKEVEGLQRLMAAVGYVGLMSVVGLSLLRFMQGRMTAGEVATFVAYSTYFLSSVSAVFIGFILIHVAKGPLERVFQVLDQRPARPLLRAPERRAAGRRLSGNVEFSHVDFAHGTGPAVLKDVTFEIRAGERVAIVGQSGCGKTTLLNLILGLYAPTSGTVRFDGISAERFSPRVLREQIGYVSQDAYFFRGSVKENISYSKWDASEERIRRAAESSNLDRFLDGLPAGYETPIGELGARLSGGQRQRLAIARVLLMNPTFLLLDEATCHQDQINEQVILDTIERIAQGRTLLVVTHSTAALRLVERILLLDEGRIVAQGVHEELYRDWALYRDLCDIRPRSLEPAAPALCEV
ncbi:MAG: ABC transporter ATP-binding protein [Thermoanaerobaculia bacterium]